MTKFIQVLKSRTAWTTAILFLVNTIPQIEGVIPTEWKPVVDGALALLVILFHVNPRQDYTPPAL